MTSPVTNTHTTRDQQIDQLINDFKALMANKTTDQSKMAELAQKIAIKLSHNLEVADRIYTLNKEEELWIHVGSVMGTHNSKAYVILTIVYGGATIAGAFIGLASIVPGTSLANTLVGKGFTFFAGGAETGKKWYTVSQVINQVAQIFPAFQKLVEDSNQSKRVFAQHQLEEARQKAQNRRESYQSNKQDRKGAIQSLHEQEQKRSQIFSEMTRSTAS